MGKIHRLIIGFLLLGVLFASCATGPPGPADDGIGDLTGREPPALDEPAPQVEIEGPGDADQPAETGEAVDSDNSIEPGTPAIAEKVPGDDSPEEPAEAEPESEAKIGPEAPVAAEEQVETAASDEVEAVVESADEPEQTPEDEEPVVAVVIEPQPQPLTPMEITSLVKQYSRGNWRPLTHRGDPILLYHDIDKNGYKDVFCLYLDLPEEEETDLSRLSDFSRLYDMDIKPFSVRAQLFFQQDRDLVPGYYADLGRQIVIRGMERFDISKTVEVPFGLSLQFQNLEGTERSWLFCRDDGYKDLLLRETFAAFIDVRDIDRDGLRDILHFEKSYEEGVGYETYITWYKWDENNYAENRIIGIVRNIKKYILEVKELLIDEQWDEIALRCAAPELQETIPYRDVRDLARHFFISSALELRNGNQDITQHRIKDVIFPEILENPFQRDPEGRYVFPLRVRVIAESGEYIYISRIQMNENPFERQQFYFQHMSEDVHN